MAASRYSRTSQPQSPARIDWGNQITRGLIEVYNPINAVSVVDNTFYNTSGTPTNAVNKSGRATYAAVASASGKTRAFGKLTSAAECTIFGVVTPVGTLGATQAFGGCASTASANPLFLIGTGSTTASQLSFRVRNAAGTNQEVVSASGVLVAGTPIIVAGSRSESQNFHRVYANGLQVGTAAASAIGATAYNTFAAHGLLRAAFGLQVGSEINLLLAWNRALTAYEIKSLSANPWQIFTPQSRQIRVPTAGGGGDITRALTGLSSAGGAGVMPFGTFVSVAGVASVGALGTVTYSAAGDLTLALTGVSADSALGVVAALHTRLLSGVGALAALGAMRSDAARGITGLAANSALGFITPQMLVGITGYTTLGNLGALIASGGINPTFSKNGSLYLSIDPELSIMLGALRLSSWNTAGRPATPATCTVGFNTDTSRIELWTGATWIGVALS